MESLSSWVAADLTRSALLTEKLGGGRRAGRTMRDDQRVDGGGRRAGNQARVYRWSRDAERGRDRAQRLQRMTEHAVLGIGECCCRGANPVGGRIVDDDRRIADRIVLLVMQQRRDCDRHRRKQRDGRGERRQTSAPEGANHQSQG